MPYYLLSPRSQGPSLKWAGCICPGWVSDLSIASQKVAPNPHQSSSHVTETRKRRKAKQLSQTWHADPRPSISLDLPLSKTSRPSVPAHLSGEHVLSFEMHRDSARKVDTALQQTVRPSFICCLTERPPQVGQTVNTSWLLHQSVVEGSA